LLIPPRLRPTQYSSCLACSLSLDSYLGHIIMFDVVVSRIRVCYTCRWVRSYPCSTAVRRRIGRSDPQCQIPIPRISMIYYIIILHGKGRTEITKILVYILRAKKKVNNLKTCSVSIECLLYIYNIYDMGCDPNIQKATTDEILCRVLSFTMVRL